MTQVTQTCPSSTSATEELSLRVRVAASTPRTTSNQTRIVWAVLAVAAGIAAVAGTTFARSRAAESTVGRVPESPPGVVAYEEDGYRYTFHAPSGTEALFETGAAAGRRRNVIDDHRDVARRLRRILETRLNVETLDSLRGEYADTIRRLHSLGYL